jgi:hypothetical protein
MELNRWMGWMEKKEEKQRRQVNQGKSPVAQTREAHHYSP